MANFLEESDVLRHQAARAASYLLHVIETGDYSVVRADLLNMGAAIGTMVAIELVKRLTPDQASTLQETMGRSYAADMPRVKARKTLHALAELSSAVGPKPAD